MDDLLPVEEYGGGMTPVAEASEEEIAAVSPTNQAISDLRALLDDESLSDAQKIAKSNRLLSNAFTETPLDSGRLVVWEDFLREAEQDTYDWVIPNLLERGERVIVVAAEGVGKTMLARQIAILSSAGMNPLTFQRIEPVTTLTIDLENPERIIRRASRKIMHEAMKSNYVRNPKAHLLTKPSGLDLMKQEDRAILERAIEEVKPQLLCIGPLYKAFVDPGGRTSESIAVEVAKYLDSLRTIYNCAMWIEHHAPLGTSITSRDLRPFGSAVWSRWPEFGLSLQPDPTAGAAYVYDVRHFRGARDERPWPTKMRRGLRFPFEVLEWMKVTT
jgi:replicative DNA helicase